MAWRDDLGYRKRVVCPPEWVDELGEIPSEGPAVDVSFRLFCAEVEHGIVTRLLNGVLAEDRDLHDS